ncbi:MAG: UDP-glucose dehydrogenase family protein [Nitrososphaerales archaeon]
MKIGVVGLGYVGLVTAVCLASHSSFDVIGVDVDSRRVSILQSATSPVKETGLDKLLAKVRLAQRFSATSDFGDLITCDVIFLTVGTPSGNDGSVDLNDLSEAARNVGSVIANQSKENAIVIKSTVPPGTTRNIIRTIIKQASNKKMEEESSIVSNPEFLAEGSAMKNFLEPDRIVIGVQDERGARLMRNLYSEFYGRDFQKIPYIETSIENAELIKYASNYFLSLKVSFINEISRICETLEHSSVDAIASGIGFDPRIGSQFLKAGPGWGGSCFRKDILGLINYAKNHNLDLPVLLGNLSTNDIQRRHVVEILSNRVGDLGGKKIGVLGLTFKANTDDIRDSQAFAIVSELRKRNVRVCVYDPVAMGKFREECNEEIECAKDIEECVSGADGVIVLTDWKEFKKLDSNFFSAHMKGGTLIDTRRMYNKDDFKGAGFAYIALGVND